jgi:hypothetical protein
MVLSQTLRQLRDVDHLGVPVFAGHLGEKDLLVVLSLTERGHQRTFLLFDALHQELAAVRAGAGVTVDLHPVSSLSVVASAPPAFKEARMNNVVRNYN